MEKIEIKELDNFDFSSIKELFRSVFMTPPWNDDWSDDNQLTEYLLDLMTAKNPLNYGLFVNDIFIGISIGNIRHWWQGTEYYVEEFCIKNDFQKKGLGTKFLNLIESELKTKKIDHIFLQTGKNIPAYDFYKKNGFEELTEHISFCKKL